MLSSGSSYWNLFLQEYHSADSQSTEYQSAEEQSAEEQNAEEQNAEEQNAEEQNAEEQSAEDPSIVSSDVKWLEENSQFNNNWALVV